MKNCLRQIIFIALLTLNLIKISVATLFSGNYNQDFIIEYAPHHVYTSPNGRFRTLSLDHDSGTWKIYWMHWTCKSFQCFSLNFTLAFLLGSGFASKEKLLFGQFNMQIKLVPGRSAGTVVAFYVSIYFLHLSCFFLVLLLINNGFSFFFGNAMQCSWSRAMVIIVTK